MVFPRPRGAALAAALAFALSTLALAAPPAPASDVDPDLPSFAQTPEAKEAFRVAAEAAHRKLSRGLAFVPQTENIFPLLTVEENLRVAGGILPRAEVAPRIDEMFAMFPDLARQCRLPAGSLSGGQRQMLAVARALIVHPRVLMLDEPSAGLSPKFVEMVFARLAEIRRDGLTIMLVEQNARAALAIGDRAYVLVEGQQAHEGPARTLWDDPVIAELYLGQRRES